MIATRDNIPNIEFSFSVSDIADPLKIKHLIWVLTRKSDELEKWVISDFIYWSWPLDLLGEYTEFREEVEAIEDVWSWDKKIPKAVWRGTFKTNKNREKLLQVSKGKDWADIREVTWRGQHMSPESDPLPMVEHCKYKFVLQTEGRSYSGRGKYLQNCRSVYIAPKSEWIEPHHSALVPSGPNQNFVEVERDFSDLEQKVQALLNDEDYAKRIADNGVAVFRDRYLTPAAQACYWRYMFKTWAEISFEPDGWERTKDSKGNDIQKLRGTAFETFA